MPKTSIAWTDYSWNPIRGTMGKWHCTKVSPGCAHCYAEWMNIRFGGPAYTVGADTLRLDEKALNEPLHWRKPRKVFVASMTDLFHEDVGIAEIADIYKIMRRAFNCTFQVLTKRPVRAAKLYAANLMIPYVNSILGNLWLGVSAENQQYADERIPILLQIPAAKRFVSLEPLLGPIDLSDSIEKLDWVIVGGESGPGARPMHTDWVRSIRDQCRAAGVPFFFKQWGEYLVKDAAISLLGDNAPVFRDCAQDRIGRRIESGAITCCNEALFIRVGKKRAGAMLDGELIQEWPQ